jgi:hypothetical protein
VAPRVTDEMAEPVGRGYGSMPERILKLDVGWTEARSDPAVPQGLGGPLRPAAELV